MLGKPRTQELGHWGIMQSLAGRPELMKEINLARAFAALKEARILSRPELAQQIGLSRATVATLSDDLLRTGVVQEVGFGTSTGGRPPVLLEFNPNAAFAVGACMRDRQWDIVVTNLDGQVQVRQEAQIGDAAPADAVASLQGGVRTVVGEMGAARVLPAIGLGTPGLVDMASGVIKSAVDIGWNDVPMREMVEDALGMPTFVANRSKVSALAELWYGSKAGVRNLIYISIGSGVAAGVVCDGQLYVGANSSAGELGHVTIVPDGPRCPCGNRGCLQQLVSGPAIANRARERLRAVGESLMLRLVDNRPEWITAQTVFAAAEGNDSLACEIVDEIAGYLGIAVANLINLFNPEVIVLGGSVGQASQVLLAPLQEEVRRRAMAYPLSVARIVKSSLGLEAGAIGAAVLVLRQSGELLF